MSTITRFEQRDIPRGNNAQANVNLPPPPTPKELEEIVKMLGKSNMNLRNPMSMMQGPQMMGDPQQMNRMQALSILQNMR